MTPNKKRLYVALYPSGAVDNEERRYHWAFLVGPKLETGKAVRGTRYHVRNLSRTSWVYEELETRDVRWTVNLLGRVVVAKVRDEARLVDIIRGTPLVQGDDGWRCRSWVAAVLARLAQDGGAAVSTAVLDWTLIEARGRAFVAEKAAVGRYSTSEELAKPKPTWDLLSGKEVIP